MAVCGGRNITECEELNNHMCHMCKHGNEFIQGNPCESCLYNMPQFICGFEPKSEEEEEEDRDGSDEADV